MLDCNRKGPTPPARSLTRSLSGMVAAAVLAGCAAPRAAPDEMCREMARFAHAVTDDSVHQVLLFNSWGGPLAQSEHAIAWKHCEHGGREAERSLCDYLMENTSTEFAARNVRRALACLRSPRSRPYMRQGAELTKLEIHSRRARFVASPIDVGVAYVADEEKMVISVQKVAARGS